MDASVLLDFRQTMSEKGIRMYGIKVETIDGDSVSHLYRSNDRICLYSASKTYTALGAGIAIDECLLHEEDKILDLFPEYQDIAAPGTEEITIRHLLRMTSGKQIRFLVGHNDMDVFGTPDNWAEEFFKQPVTAKPGEVFSYSNMSPYMVALAVEKVSGMTLRDYLIPRLFTPMEIFNPGWFTCPMGHTVGYSKLFLNLEEFSRLGHLMLHKGCYKGRRIVSELYIQRMMSDLSYTTNTSPYADTDNSVGYGYFIWKAPYADAFYASGRYGKTCIFVPSRGICVTYLAHEETRTAEIDAAVFQTIIDPLYPDSREIPYR